MVFEIQTLRNTHSDQGWISTLWNQTKFSFKCYCNTTKLHGFKYITRKDSSFFTRILFAFSCCFSLILCGYLTVSQVFEHQQNSILTTVRSTAYPVWKLPFPSVTVCNFNIVYKDNIKFIFKSIKSRGIEENIFMDFVQNLSTLILHDSAEDVNSYQEVIVALEQVGYTTDKLMAELAHPCVSMLKKCFWQSEEVKCSEIFQTVKTSQGYCCSFNYNAINTKLVGVRVFSPVYSHHTAIFCFVLDSHAKHWDDPYVGGAGPSLGLRVLLDIEETQYISAIRPLYGFKVLVQDGTAYPDIDVMGNSLLSAEELTVSVTPRIYDSSENIRSMAVKRRNCLFDSEDIMGWSSTYSFETCISQCKAKTILQFCNCIPYYYYHIEKNNRICTFLDEPCLQKNKYAYNVLGVTDSFLTDVDIRSSGDAVVDGIQCNCYPQCNEQIFDFQTDRSTPTPMDGFQVTNRSILNVYYNTVGCIETSRDSYYTWDHVFASVGGIFALCLGVSLISILECFFFMGKCIPKFKKNKSGVMKHKEPEIYLSDFAFHHYRN